MSVAAQQTASSPMETTTEDVDMIASSVLPASNDNSPSLATRCMAFQTRIDSYASELSRLEAMNRAIHEEYRKHQQEQCRDRLIDSASPEPKSVAVREERYQIITKKSKERRRRLTQGLEVVRVGMEKLKNEIESVHKGLNVHNS